MKINIFIQARMSSSRYPGKVLAPLHNKPLIKHLIDSAKSVTNANNVVVLTSLDESDDPLVAYLQQINCDYFRGSLENVYLRFVCALKEFPCDYMVRLSADSPLMNKNLIEYMISKSGKHDIVSNVVVRSFPKGQSIEVINTEIFTNIDNAKLSLEDKEHVLPYFYKNNDYKILSIENKADESMINMCVDTLQDLQYLSSTKLFYQFRQNTYVE